MVPRPTVKGFKVGIVNFVFRRGAIYTWRRRIPARVACDALHLQISLGTACPWTARRLGGLVTFESEQVFEAMALDGLTREAARKWLERVVREELEKIERRNRAQSDSREPGYARTNAAEDRSMGHALRLLARDGVRADLGEIERAEIVAKGVPAHELPKIDRYLQQAAGEAPSEAVEAKIRRGVAEVADLSVLNVHQFLDSRQIYLRGRAAAYLTASQRTDPKFAEALDLAEALTGKMVETPQAASASTGREVPVKEEPAYDPAIIAVADRLVRKKEAREKATQKTAYQIRNTAALFVEAAGIADIREMRQSDLARFCDTMAQLPPTYRKSSKEKNMPLSEIIAAAAAREAKVGLSPATVNRNLGFIGQLIKQARSEGIELDVRLDTRDLREADDEDDQEKVPPFTRDEVKAIFLGAIWQGCASDRYRTRPGTLVLKDGLYWIPLIAAYCGARHEEIAGLVCSDIVYEEDIWAFNFSFNEIRRVKNKPSRRKVPIHEHLLELGLIEHMQRIGSGQLFPELKRKSQRANLGDAIHYHWRKMLDKQLGDMAENKRFHSFRHYITGELRYKQKLSPVTRHHILGHALESVEDRHYGSRSPLADLKLVIDALPRVF